MRYILRFAMLVAILIAIGSPPVPADSANALTPEGSWLVKVIAFPGEPFELKLQYLQSFNKDGRTTVLLSTGGPADYPETGDPRTGCMGEWQKSRHAGGPVFDVTQGCLYSQEWVPSPTSPWYPFYRQELQVEVSMQPDGDTWSGPFVISDYDVDGILLWSGGGVMEATRIKVKALP